MRKLKSLLKKGVDFLYRNQNKICWGIENLDNIIGVANGIIRIFS